MTAVHVTGSFVKVASLLLWVIYLMCVRVTQTLVALSVVAGVSTLSAQLSCCDYRTLDPLGSVNI